MKIGILTSGNDMLALFSFLQRYDHEYHVWYDDTFLFWWDKPVELVMERVTQGIRFLQEKGVDTILVPPIIELKIRNEKLFPGVTFLPLFESYVKENCFTYSLVGKLGFFGDLFDLEEWQKQLTILAKDYVLSDHQREIKKFHVPFAWRGREVRNWKYLLDTCSWSMPLLHHMVKQDLRYFKDAKVDTIIPCNYSYFLVQKAIEKARYTNMRFYGLSILENIFTKIVETKQNWIYSVNVYHTGHGKFLSREKKLQRMLSRWNTINVAYNAL